METPGQEDRKTRIPTRFKMAANRVRRERSMPNRTDGEITLPSQPRRSSIPRLRTKPATPKTEEDEFDKIYGEIVDSPVDIDVSLLNNKVDDPDKVENCFEEIIHDYDEGRIKPISVEPVTKIPKATDKVIRTATDINAGDVKKALKDERAASGIPRRKSIDKAVTERVITIDKPRDSRLEKSASVDQPAVTDRIRNVDKTLIEDKVPSVDKSKSRIPMLKRRSEPEIDVPKSVHIPKGNSSGIRNKVQDAIHKFSKDDDKSKKLPSRIAISKTVGNDNAKGHQKPASRIIDDDDDKHKLETENIKVHMSIESDIEPQNIINDNVSETANESVIQGNSIEIVELTPAMGNLEISDLQITSIEPSIIEIIEAPPTAPITETNHQDYIQEIIEASPVVVETTELQPNEILHKVENEPTLKPTPIKVVSTEELEIMAREMIKNKPVIQEEELEILKAKAKLMNANLYDVEFDETKDPQSRHNAPKKYSENKTSLDRIRNIEAVPISQTINSFNADENNSNDTLNQTADLIKADKNPINKEEKIKKYDSDDDVPILRGKVSRMIKRLGSRDEPKKEVIEELPKLKSVMSKIAMFERQEPINPAPKTETKHKYSRIASNPNDYTPKIINEVLKPAQRKVDLVEDGNKDYNLISTEPISLENTNNKQVEAVNVRLIPTSTSIMADEAVYEEAAVINEIIPNNYSKKDDINEAKNKDIKIYRQFKEEVPMTNEIVNIIETTPIKVEYIAATKQTINYEPTADVNRIEVVDLKPVEFTSKINDVMPVRVTKDFEPRVNGATENAKFDRSKEKIESPFHFTPNENSHRIRNYNYDNQDNETPSLDYVLDRLSRYKSTFDESNLKKSKSVAELDLGDAVKGKVHDMIVRMKSVDKLAVEKREVISVKERPRKKSVSEKIALFEGKLSYNTNSAPSRLHKAAQRRTEDTMSPEELKTKIAELSAAKLTFGRVTNMTYVVLANGQEMPVLSIGTALLDKQLTPHVVAAAIEMGYRGIDAAFIYGNEREVGEGIRAKIEDGTVKREDLFVVNKLWSTFHRQDLVEDACRRSLDAMGLDYFDLYLIHNPMSFKEGGDPIPTIANVIQYSKHDYLEAWYGLERLVSQGLVRAIGVSNFNSAQLQRVLDRARIKPVVNMVECHPYLTQTRLDDFCAVRNVKLFAYGVLGSKGTPLELRGSTAAVVDDPLVQVMAAGLGVTPAQLLIRYQIDSGHVAVVKASSGSHLWDNLQALALSLTDAQLDTIRALNRNKRTFIFKGMGDTHKNYPFNIAF